MNNSNHLYIIWMLVVTLLFRQGDYDFASV